MKRFSKGSVLILLPLVAGLWLWFSAESQPQTKPAAQNSTSVSGQLSPQPGTGQNATVETPAPQNTQQTITADQLLTELERQAKDKNPRAMLFLGTLYERGLNNAIKRNLGKALTWYQQAADLDLPEGIYNVGVCYEIGMGTAPDQKKAMDSYLKAAEKGLPQAELKLASLYLTGEGVTADVPKGLDYLKKAADKNFPQAQMELGFIYYYGNYETKRDLTKARELFQKAADMGDPAAMQNLGVMSVAGEGMEANKPQGLRWYLLAQMFGVNAPDIQKTIDGLKAELKPEEVTAVEADAKDWSDKFRAKVEAEQAANQAASQAAADAEKAAAGN
jgi:TPR repeat protein